MPNIEIGGQGVFELRATAWAWECCLIVTVNREKKTNPEQTLRITLVSDAIYYVRISRLSLDLHLCMYINLAAQCLDRAYFISLL